MESWRLGGEVGAAGHRSYLSTVPTSNRPSAVEALYKLFIQSNLIYISLTFRCCTWLVALEKSLLGAFT